MEGPKTPTRFFVFVLNGQVIGKFSRTVAKNKLVLGAEFFRPVTSAETLAFQSAAHRYAAFLDLELDWNLAS